MLQLLRLILNSGHKNTMLRYYCPLCVEPLLFHSELWVVEVVLACGHRCRDRGGPRVAAMATKKGKARTSGVGRSVLVNEVRWGRGENE